MTTLRITAGALRGRRIAVPKDDVRPTSERARQAYFNIIGDRIQDARFLDLFAGSGIFSFEAVSRGARASVAVDIARSHTHAIERMARELEVAVKAVQSDVLVGIKRLGSAVFDLVYADPPYDYGHYDQLLTAIDTELPLAPDALVAIEHRRHTNPFPTPPNRLREWRRSEYGEVWITFFIT
ncbi:MAG TPA: 16S rRNA (guanine(966)-N(2))-methyltransferase RsmD [Thermoanaerobaculia bacterium]|nr:16S rRNA (guanine(966)-N(2))-methyltransferase RsmD [Thermoanaerobaculia bacterium]